jgi:hypothetical protein
MANLYTASQIHEIYCSANGMVSKEYNAALNRFRYMAKRGLLSEGSVVDQRGTYAFPKVEVYRAVLYMELAGLTMDLRAFAPIGEAAARDFSGKSDAPPSMRFDGGIRSYGGLKDAINGVAQDERWLLSVELQQPGFVENGRLKAEFHFEDTFSSEREEIEANKILGRTSSRAKVIVDLKMLFTPIIAFIGVPI